MTQDDDYEVWLSERRAILPTADLADRIMAAVDSASRDAPIGSDPESRPIGRFRRTAPILLWTAASLVFVARIAALVGNLIFPTGSYPEFATDHRIEEPRHEHRSISRS